jgi:hypothetical protein
MMFTEVNSTYWEYYTGKVYKVWPNKYIVSLNVTSRGTYSNRWALKPQGQKEIEGGKWF